LHDPAAAQDAATKNYVDTQITGLNVGQYVQKAGDTMTGRLVTAAGTGATQGLKLTSGSVLTAPAAADAGSIEFNGTSLSYIDSTGARQTLSTSVAGGYLPLS